MTVTIHNNESILSPNDVNRLQHAVASWPFDTQIVVETARSRAVFEGEMRGWVQTPATVAIGVDPSHHVTITRFGSEAGVGPEFWNEVSKAGDPLFKQQRWVDGILAIGARAELHHQQPHVVQTVPIVSQPTPVFVPPKEHHMPGWVAPALIVALLVGLALPLFFIYRAKKKSEAMMETLRQEREEAEAERQRRREEADWHEKFKEATADTEVSRIPPPVSAARPVYQRNYRPVSQAPVYAPPPQPPVVVVGNQGGGSGDLATGMLLGEMVGRSEREEIVHDHVVERVYESPKPRYREPEPSYSSSSSSPNDDDAGGSSSDYGSSSSSSSDDSGGSSSDYGGSSDSGGGGSDFGGSSDSGGGSSDW